MKNYYFELSAHELLYEIAASKAPLKSNQKYEK